MIKMAVIPNPFEPYFKRLEDKEYISIKNLKAYYPEGELFIINGEIIDNPESYIPADFTVVIVTAKVQGGGIGKFLGFVAMVAVMVYAGAVAGGAWSSWAGAAFKAGHLGAVLAGAAVATIGGMVVNSIFPQQTATLAESENSSPTYGWDVPAPANAEGNVVGMTYGECIPQAQVLTQHVETCNGKQYLCLLLCGGQGPIDSISNIRIGNNAIGNYSDVQIETRLGTNEQTPISFFNNNPIDQYVSLELDTSSPLIQTTTSKSATSLEVTMTWPGGLYKINDDGNYENTTVKMLLEYRVAGTSAWTTWLNTWNVTNNTNSELNQSVRISGLAAAQYEVRVTLIERDTSSRAATITRWTLLTTYDNGAYSRPGKVLVGLRILATNQLSGGVPSINWRQRKDTVWVWNPYNRCYERRSADNPIWAAYDILHRCDRLLNINTGGYEFVVNGCAVSRLTKYWDQWVTAAAYSDGLVNNQNGEQEKRFMFDVFYDTSQKKIAAAQKAAKVGHATILKHGNDLGIVVDMPGDITQIFGEGRTTAESVSGFFTGSDERARVLEITYNDKNDDYKNTRFLCRSNNWLEDDRENDPTPLSLFGVARRSQAWREGIKAILTNQLQLQYVEFKADVDALRSEFGDIIGWNHRANRIGIESGRVVSADASSVKLDKNIDFSSGKTYEIWIQKSDDTLVHKTFAGTDVTTDTISVSLATSEIPAQYDNYALGLVDAAVKPFRIVNIGISQDQLCSIKCCEYNAAVYADSDIDYSQFPVKNYTETIVLQAPINLALKELNYVRADMTHIHTIIVSWSLPRGARADHFNVQLSENGNSWTTVGSTEAFKLDINGLNPPRTYYVRVCSVLDGMISSYSMAVIAMTGADELPPDITGLHHELLADGTRRFWWDFVYPTPNDIAGFKLKYIPNGVGTWDTALPLNSGLVTAQPFETAMLRQGMASVLIKAVDNTGQESKNAAVLSVNLGDVLKDNILFEKDMSDNSWADVDTDGYIDPETHVLKSQESAAMWDSPEAPMWTTPEDAIWSTNYKSFSCSFTFTAIASGNLWVDLVLDGPAKVTYTVNGQEYPYTQKVTVKAGDSLIVTITAFAGTQQVILSKAVIYIDVPDVVEHLDNVVVPVDGVELPLKTPHYYTTAVRIDAVENNAIVWPKIVTRNPCVIKLYNSSGAYVAGTIDCTWQGFIKELTS